MFVQNKTFIEDSQVEIAQTILRPVDIYESIDGKRLYIVENKNVISVISCDGDKIVLERLGNETNIKRG